MRTLDNSIYSSNAVPCGGAEGSFFFTISSKNATCCFNIYNCVQGISNNSVSFTFTGKERDEETGYGYFGARYMDHELMTMWLSVDPMADKYPSISPYAYCAWNPVKLVDPDGMDTLIFSHKGYYEKTLPGGDNIGIIRRKDGGYGARFKFADERWCIRFVACSDMDIAFENFGRDRDNLLYNKVVYVGDPKIELLLIEKELEFVNLRSQSLKYKIDCAKNQSRGAEAKLDFVNYRGVQEMNPYALIITGFNGKYLAHDKFNFGNFLWGMAMRRMGMPAWLVLAGSHWDCYRNTKRLDSPDDQRSIWFGYNKVRK